ncbi:MAG: hypothetical protein GX257_04590 [Clostridiales bacterium]|nr:hypothetical protein [Clostridiales bacterium]
MRVRPVKPITQAYFHQPTRKEINVRAKIVEKKPDATDRFTDIEPICDRITRAAIVGTVIFLAVHVLIWVLR